MDILQREIGVSESFQGSGKKARYRRMSLGSL